MKALILVNKANDITAMADIGKFLMIGGIIVSILLVIAIFVMCHNTEVMKEKLTKMHRQNAEIYKLIDLTNELLSIEIREQRAIHGKDVNTRLDGERPDE